MTDGFYQIPGTTLQPCCNNYFWDYPGFSALNKFSNALRNLLSLRPLWSLL